MDVILHGKKKSPVQINYPFVCLGTDGENVSTFNLLLASFKIKDILLE